MKSKLLFALAISLLFIVNTGQASLQAEPVQLSGTGSTFSQPLIDVWASEYNNLTDSFVQVSYGGGGSGVGITQITAGTINFAGSDAPMSASETAAANQYGGTINHIPETMGAIVMTYNIPGFSGTLKLTASNIAQIYQLNITKWNDPALTVNNPGLASITSTIKVVARSDSSGTSFVFSDYLTHATSDWALGTSKSPNWPGGVLGGNGNGGVAGLVSSTTNSIGYVEYGYAQANNLNAAQLQNKAGNWVAPSSAGVTAAASEAATNLPSGSSSWSNVSINDQPGATTYPICTLTYLLVYTDLTSYGAQGAALVSFLTWMMTDTAQNMGTSLGFVPLPSNVRQVDLTTISTLKINTSYNSSEYSPTTFTSSSSLTTTSTNQATPGFEILAIFGIFPLIAIKKIKKNKFK